MSLAYFKLYPADFLLGTETLKDDQFAAYTKILCKIYMQGRPIEMAELKGLLGTVRKVKRIVSELIEIGKIYLTKDGRISNKRCDTEIERRQEAYKRQVAGGKKSKPYTRKSNPHREAERGEFDANLDDLKCGENKVLRKFQQNFGKTFSKLDAGLPETSEEENFNNEENQGFTYDIEISNFKANQNQNQILYNPSDYIVHLSAKDERRAREKSSSQLSPSKADSTAPGQASLGLEVEKLEKPKPKKKSQVDAVTPSEVSFFIETYHRAAAHIASQRQDKKTWPKFEEAAPSTTLRKKIGVCLRKLSKGRASREEAVREFFRRCCRSARLTGIGSPASRDFYKVSITWIATHFNFDAIIDGEYDRPPVGLHVAGGSYGRRFEENTAEARTARRAARFAQAAQFRAGAGGDEKPLALASDQSAEFAAGKPGSADAVELESGVDLFGPEAQPNTG